MCEVTFMLAQVRLRLECCPSPSAVYAFSDVYGADQQREWSATRKLTDPPPVFLALDADWPHPVQKQDDVDRDPHDGHGHVHAHHARACCCGRARRFAKLGPERHPKRGQAKRHQEIPNDPRHEPWVVLLYATTVSRIV